MSPIAPLRCTGGTYVLIGETSLPPDDDGFILGVTEPTALNTGLVDAGILTTYTGLATFAGSSDPLNPTIIHDKIINMNLRITSGYVDFYNCDFRGSGTETGDYGLITLWAGTVGMVKINRCKLRPTNPSWFINGVLGHHFELIRCDISYVVDGVGIYNQYGRSANAKVLGNYIHDLVHYYDPVVGVVHPSDTHTHNDAVQVQGGEDVWIEGNAFWGYGKEENGSIPAGVYFRSSQAVVLQQNVGVGGVYYMANMHVNNNFVYGFRTVFSFKARTGGTPYNVECVNNTLRNSDQENDGSVNEFFIIRPGNITNVNGISYPIGISIETLDTNGNVYDTTTLVRVDLRGTPVGIRRDDFS